MLYYDMHRKKLFVFVKDNTTDETYYNFFKFDDVGKCFCK